MNKLCTRMYVPTDTGPPPAQCSINLVLVINMPFLDVTAATVCQRCLDITNMTMYSRPSIHLMWIVMRSFHMPPWEYKHVKKNPGSRMNSLLHAWSFPDITNQIGCLELIRENPHQPFPKSEINSFLHQYLLSNFEYNN